MAGDRPFFALAIAATLACAQAAAADDAFRPSFAIDGSLPLIWGSNPTHETGSAGSGALVSPYFQLSASGSIASDSAYLFYANTNADKSLTSATNDADDSQAAIGATLQQRWGNFSVHIGAERNFFYDRIYSQFDSAANDFAIGARYRYSTPDGNLRVRPSATFTTRANDNFAVERYAYSAKIDFDRRLSGPWWLLVTPRLRFYDYHGDESGRQDVVASISVGLRYLFNENVSLNTGIGYENRRSNVADRNFDNVMIGASLDFSFGFNGPDWIYERSSGASDARSH